MGERRGVYSVLVGKPVGKRQLGRHGIRRGYNNKIGLQEVKFGSMDWINLSQNRNRCWAFVIAVMNFRVP
jgi:hypothetical protein